MYCGTLKIIKYGKHIGKNEEKLQPIFWMIPILDTRSASSTSRGRYKGSTPLSTYLEGGCC